MADQGERGQDSSDQPPSPPRPPAYTGPFLFVNKNATNLRSRQRDEVFAVRSHAMQIARRSRKPSTAESTKAKQKAAEDLDRARIEGLEENAPEQAAATTEGETSGQQQDSRPSSASQGPGFRNFQAGELRPTVSRTSTGRSQVSLGSLAGRSQVQVAPVPSTINGLLPAQHLEAIMQHVMGAIPGTPMRSGSSDPFTAAALPITSFFNSLLQFWRVGYMSNFWPASIYLDPSHAVPKLTDDWVRGAVISNPAMLHGLFAGTLSFITNFVPATAATPVLWARGMHHHGKCLEFTRSRLAMPGVNSEEALGMIHQSTTFSFHCGDFDASTVHRVASARILDTLEHGLDSVHPVLKYLVILCDALLASHVPRRPSLDVESWAPDSWHVEDSLRPFDDLFSFDPSEYTQSDRDHFLFSEPIYGNDGENFTLQVQSMVNLQREALHACDLASKLSASEGVASADLIYDWLALRQYALICRSASLYMDMIESEPPEPQTDPLSLQLQRVLHSCIVLGTNYTFQCIMRCSMDNLYTGYIPFHHLRNRLTLLMTLMGEARRMQTTANLSVPTETLLFLFFAGAVAEEVGGHTSGSPSQQAGHYGDFVPASTQMNLLHVRWFSVHFSMILQRMGLASWEAAKAILETFVYDERVMDGYLQVLVRKRSEFLGVLAGSGSRAVGRPAQPATGAITGPSRPLIGQENATSSGSSHVSPVPISTYQPAVPPLLPSALSPIAGPDFAAGFWEHMGLGLEPSMEFDTMDQGDMDDQEDMGFNSP